VQETKSAQALCKQSSRGHPLVTTCSHYGPAGATLWDKSSQSWQHQSNKCTPVWHSCWHPEPRSAANSELQCASPPPSAQCLMEHLQQKSIHLQPTKPRTKRTQAGVLLPQDKSSWARQCQHLAVHGCRTSTAQLLVADGKQQHVHASKARRSVVAPAASQLLVEACNRDNKVHAGRCQANRLSQLCWVHKGRARPCCPMICSSLTFLPAST